MISKVYKTIRVCPCGSEYTYYRLPGELGRSQSYCSDDCKEEQLVKRLKSRELVDLLSIPAEWQKKLEKRLVKPKHLRVLKHGKV